jgi:hypothetical protein
MVDVSSRGRDHSEKLFLPPAFQILDGVVYFNFSHVASHSYPDQEAIGKRNWNMAEKEV